MTDSPPDTKMAFACVRRGTMWGPVYADSHRLEMRRLPVGSILILNFGLANTILSIVIKSVNKSSLLILCLIKFEFMFVNFVFEKIFDSK